MRRPPWIVRLAAKHRRLACALAIGGLAMGMATAGWADTQRVVFGPTIASASGPDGTAPWTVRVQGRVFEPAEGSRKRQWMVDALAPVLGGNRRDPLYRQRAGLVVSDSVDNTRIAINILGRVVTLPKSDAAGCFASDVALTSAESARLQRQGKLHFRLQGAKGRPGGTEGIALAVPAHGVTVVTDIDDTIKDTHMADPQEAKANTFVRPFKAVPGMADLYRGWQAASGGALHFHVVSAGPWQLHAALQQFTNEAGFPAFSWDMRCIDLTDPSQLVKELLAPDPQRLQDFKLASIRALMQRLPERHVVLVGDSGERDPETYADIVKEFGARVDAVYIRDMDPGRPERRNYDALYPTSDARAKLQVFARPTDLPSQLAAPR